MEQVICCPNPDCRGTDLEYSEPDGATICMACHTIVEENAIVSSVEFNENNAGGASTVVGQFVGPEMTKAYSSAGRGRRRFYARDSRDTTLNNGRRAIQQVVSQLRLRQAFVDRACRLFRTAVERNFVQGRKTMCVVAVCLYMVCREDNSPHMLIDFSDAVQINVYVLGHAFLKFKQLTGLNLAVIDPSIYIHRFAARMELGSEQEQTKVSNLALRLVASMQRDWIQAGRRPSGICGAALYLSAIYHDKPRTYKDVGRIVRVSPDTIKKRVNEFEKTPISGQMTSEQLSNMSLQDFENPRHGLLAQEADPPCYTRALDEKAAKRAAAEEAARASQSLGKKKRTEGEDEEEEEEEGQEQENEPERANVADGRKRKRKKADGQDEEEEEGNLEGGAGALAIDEEEGEDVGEDLYKELMDKLLDEEEERARQKGEEEPAANGSSSSTTAATINSSNKRGPAGASAALAPAASSSSSSSGGSLQPREGQAPRQPAREEEKDEQQEDALNEGEEEEEEEDREDEEQGADDTDQYIRTDEEVAKLSKVWHEVHRGYLEKQARKKADEEVARRRAEEDFNYRPPSSSASQRKRAAAAAAAPMASGGSGGGGGGGAQASGQSRSTDLMQQAVTNHLAKKRVSKKINYEAVKLLGNEEDDEALPPELEAMINS